MGLQEKKLPKRRYQSCISILSRLESLLIFACFWSLRIAYKYFFNITFFSEFIIIICKKMSEVVLHDAPTHLLTVFMIFFAI